MNLNDIKLDQQIECFYSFKFKNDNWIECGTILTITGITKENLIVKQHFSSRVEFLLPIDYLSKFRKLEFPTQIKCYKAPNGKIEFVEKGSDYECTLINNEYKQINNLELENYERINLDYITKKMLEY